MNFVPVALLGSQTPRLESVPPAVSSAGPDAVEYCASVGLVLDPWQERVLDGALRERGSRWAALEVVLSVPRQNGKGAVLEARELAGIELFGDRLILHTAHELKTAEEARLRMEQICEASPELDRQVLRVVRTNGKEAIEFRNGARIKYVARSKGSGRGFSADLVVFDEAMFLAGAAMDALLPALGARPNPQIWYTGSAGLDESVEWLRLHERGREGKDLSLTFLEWSAPPDADLDDRAVWAMANPALGIRLTEEFIAKEREALTEVGFSRERLGIWHDSARETVINLDVWHSLEDRGSRIPDPTGRVVFALDATPDRSGGSIALAGSRPDGLLHVEVVENRRGIGWMAARIAELKQRWRPLAVLLDPGGPAGSLVAELETSGIDCVYVSGRDMTQACGLFYDEANAQKFRHIGQPALNVALGAARKRPVGDAWAWHRRDTTDISPLVATTLAVFGARKHGTKPKSTYQPKRLR